MKRKFFHMFGKLGTDPTRRKTERTAVSGLDVWLAIAVIVLSLFGILMVYNSSVAIALRQFGDPNYFFREQTRGLALGYILFSLFAFVDYRRFKPVSAPLLFVTVGLLMAVFIPGIGVSALGARRWIRLFGIVVQPAEIAKFSLILYLSAWFSNPEKGRFFPFLLLLAMLVSLVMLEPDMGTSIVLVTIAFLMYFVSGAPFWHFLLALPAMISGAMVMAITSPYRMRRLLTFLDPDSDPQGASYQIRQAMLAIGSGGLTGVGLGMSRQKYEYLPEANTDSIFAVIAEETGFIGALFLLWFYGFIFWRGLRIARNAPDTFGRLVATGITVWITFQAGFNISAMTAIMPLTGIPLPLVSYGSSSLVIMLASLGILLNISRHAKESKQYGTR